MPQNNDNTKIKILATIASHLYTEARSLLIAGTGEDMMGDDVINVSPEIDTIPSDSDGYRWAKAAARFLRHVATVLSPALQEFYDERRENYISYMISNPLGDIENVDPTLFDNEGEI